MNSKDEIVRIFDGDKGDSHPPAIFTQTGTVGQMDACGAYWPDANFDAGKPQRQLSKEFVREWLMENGFQGKAGQQVPEMTDEIVNGISDRYIELYEKITGEKFVKSESDNLEERIFNNVNKFLAEYK